MAAVGVVVWLGRGGSGGRASCSCGLDRKKLEKSIIAEGEESECCQSCRLVKMNWLPDETCRIIISVGTVEIWFCVEVGCRELDRDNTT
jgi:hypothetical protein